MLYVCCLVLLYISGSAGYIPVRHHLVTVQYASRAFSVFYGTRYLLLVHTHKKRRQKQICFQKKHKYSIQFCVVIIKTIL